MLKGRPDGCGLTTALLHGVDLWPTHSSSSAFALVGVNLLSLGLDGTPHEHHQDAKPSRPNAGCANQLCPFGHAPR